MAFTALQNPFSLGTGTASPAAPTTGQLWPRRSA